MELDDTDVLLGAYLDGELSPGEAMAMERRLAADPALRSHLGRMQRLSGSMRDVLAEVPVPDGLRARIVERLGPVEVMPRPIEQRRWLSMAAALLVGLFGGGAIGYGLSHVRNALNEDTTLDAVYAGHLRGLAAPQPFDIASSDRHVVKPWFNGRTAIAPDAPDLGAEGYPLAGGRVDVVGGERVPTLVYRRREHVISVTIVPRREGTATDTGRREGTNIERWSAGDLEYVAVSDLNPAELHGFAELFRSRTRT